MYRQNTTSHMRSPWRLLLGILCVGLVLLGGTLSVTHSHPDGAPHSDCGLCATAHLTVQVATPFTQIAVALVFIRVEAVTVSTRPRTILSNFALFTRPPPAIAHLS